MWSTSHQFIVDFTLVFKFGLFYIMYNLHQVSTIITVMFKQWCPDGVISCMCPGADISNMYDISWCAFRPYEYLSMSLNN